MSDKRKSGYDMRGQRSLTALTVVAGVVVGVPTTASAVPTAAATHGRLVELGTLELGYADMHAVNGRGDIIGSSTSDVGGRAVIWPHDSRTPIALPADGGRVAALNEHGDVVGTAHVDGFIWHDGVQTLLAHPGAAEVRPTDVNDARTVVGNLLFPDSGTTRAFVWRAGQFTELPTPAGHGSVAHAVNDRGQVLGAVTDDRDGISRPVLWHRDGMWKLPATLQAVGLNNRGDVLANSAPAADGTQRPYLWRHGRLRALLAGTGLTSGTAVALNDAGDVVGNSGGRPFRWHDGRLTRIDVAGATAAASFLNDRSDVAGTAVTRHDGRPVAYRWRAGRTTYYSAAAGVCDVVVKGIDDRGRVVGEYVTADGHGVVFRAAS
jgi:uncharacterized membrane protein